MNKTVAGAIVLLVVIAAFVGFKALSKRKRADEPLISLVYLLSAPRKMSEADVRARAAEAFAMIIEDDKPDASQFVVALPPPPLKGVPRDKGMSFMVKVDQTPLLVNEFAMPYVDPPDAFAAKIHDRRLRHAISAHRAWISVDALGEIVGAEAKARAYRAIGKMSAALAGPDCLAIYCPELQRCNEYDPALLNKLRSDDPLSLFREPTFAPIIDVADDDSRMAGAVAEARRRWPEFVSAFRQVHAPDAPFIIKAEFKEGDKAEFMWVSVTAIEGDTIRGVLENDPYELSNVTKGQEVNVPLSILNDWMYSKDGKAVGGFTLEVIKEVQKE